MTTPLSFKNRLRLPVIGSPLFIISNPSLVIEQCKAGIVGSFPSLNARSTGELDEWLAEITEELAAWDRQHPERPSAPFAVNEIVHRTNSRWESDLELCVKHKAPIVISSLGANEDLNKTVHAYGGVTFHDVINDRYARKAIEKGATGLIPVACGAGGHAGQLSPFALMQEIRQWFDGPVALAGSIASGRSILAAEAMGADFAYIGSPFIATVEARATQANKQAVVEARADGIVYTNLFTGIHGNYLASSIRSAGLDPDELPESDPSQMNWGSNGNTKAKVWKDIWGCGQGIGVIDAVRPVADLVARLASEYTEAKQELDAKSQPFGEWS